MRDYDVRQAVADALVIVLLAMLCLLVIVLIARGEEHPGAGPALLAALDSGWRPHYNTSGGAR